MLRSRQRGGVSGMGRYRKFALGVGAALACSIAAAADAPPRPTAIPTGQLITPLAAPGAVFQPLNPGLPALPDFTVDHAASMSLSPDGKTLLILTSGFNRNVGPDGMNIATLSNEYVFVYDVAGDTPRK